MIWKRGIDRYSANAARLAKILKKLCKVLLDSSGMRKVEQMSWRYRALPHFEDGDTTAIVINMAIGDAVLASPEQGSSTVGMCF